jgi:cysteine-rich repeat protein
LDNCVDAPNPDQGDADFDGRGDACEPIPTTACVHELPDRFIAVFGYENLGQDLRIMPGALNSLSAGTVLGEHPVLFEAGTVSEALFVEFDGAPITWRLFETEVSVDADSERCELTQGSPGCLEVVGGLSCCTELSECATAAAVGLYATSSLALADRARVLDVAGDPGPVVNLGGPVSLGVEAKTGDVVSGGGVILADRAEVLGSILASGSVQTGNDTVILGPIAEGQSIAAPTLDDFAFPVSPGDDDVIVPADGFEQLPAGDYAALHVHPRAVLSLVAGVYKIASLILEPESALSLDTTLGSVTLHVTGDVILRGVVPSSDAFLLVHHGNGHVSLEAAFDGTVISPNGTISLRTQGSPFAGSFFAKHIEVQPDVVVQTHHVRPEFLGAAGPPPECGDGVVEPGEACDDGNTDSGDGCSSSCASESNECSVAAAVDLGGPGNNNTVATDGCVRVLDGYPSWWQTRNMNLQTTSGGTYPVPFSWENPCTGAGGSGVLTSDWQGLTFGPTSDQCHTLIDLSGSGSGSVTLRYY